MILLLAISKFFLKLVWSSYLLYTGCSLNIVFFSELFKIFRTLFSLGVCVCTHSRQVENQRFSRTGRVQKNRKILRKKHILPVVEEYQVWIQLAAATVPWCTRELQPRKMVNNISQITRHTIASIRLGSFFYHVRHKEEPILNTFMH